MLLDLSDFLLLFVDHDDNRMQKFTTRSGYWSADHHIGFQDDYVFCHMKSIKIHTTIYFRQFMIPINN